MSYYVGHVLLGLSNSATRLYDRMLNVWHVANSIDESFRKPLTEATLS